MRQLWLVVALASTGCNQLLGIDELTRVDAGSEVIDSSLAIDAAQIDAPAGMICAMLVAPAVCIPLASGAITVGDINTDTDAKCTTVAGPGICAIVGDTITIPASSTSTITGSKPLMLIATTTIKISGALDASSTSTGQRGAGSEPVPTACGTLGAGMGTSDGGGGGAGGTFGTKGGDGGKGGGGSGGLGAIGDPAPQASVFRAGCRGSAGGKNTNGAGGFGGGALYLVAGESIDIESRVDANGAGGAGATNGEAGGGGGGSGGMLVLEAPSITMTSSAQITANGGGGGEGTVGTSAQAGEQSDDWDAAAIGGTGLSQNGGAGGAGAIGTGVGGIGIAGISGGNNNDGGGGGGGGGVGLVWIRGVAPTGPQAGQISPPFVPK